MEPPQAENRREYRVELVMTDAVSMVEIYRGGFLESVHRGHAVALTPNGDVVAQWGDPDRVILPRSSAKMIQALPLMESGAGAHLTSEQLALACASHSGELRHVERVNRWLADLGLDDDALLCGPQASRDRELRHEMIRRGEPVTRVFNNCSGKHTGFLTLAMHLGAPLNYVDPDNPVQVAVKAAFEDMTGQDSLGFGIDGCSAPNFVTTVRGLAQAAAKFAVAGETSGARDRAAAALRDAIMKHPELVSGKGRACAAFMTAANTPIAVKTGAEGVFLAILPEQEVGLAVKIEDGATRASEVATAALLTQLGALDADHPMVARYLKRPIRNWDGLVTGFERPAAALLNGS